MSAAVTSNLRPTAFTGFCGKNLKLNIKAVIPIGIFIANNQGQFPTDNIPAAIVGPAAADTDTTKALMPHTSPQKTFGINNTDQGRIHARYGSGAKTL